MQNRQLGQLFLMGFEGTTISDKVRILIEQYHIGSILLTAKNLKCMQNYVVGTQSLTCAHSRRPDHSAYP